MLMQHYELWLDDIFVVQLYSLKEIEDLRDECVKYDGDGDADYRIKAFKLEVMFHPNDCPYLEITQKFLSLSQNPNYPPPIIKFAQAQIEILRQYIFQREQFGKALLEMIDARNDASTRGDTILYEAIREGLIAMGKVLNPHGCLS